MSITNFLTFYNLLGVKVWPLTIAELNALIKSVIEEGHKSIISNHNIHSLYLFHHDPKMREFYGSSHYIHIDGMPIILFGRILGLPVTRSQRVTYADWIWPLIEEAAKNDWRIFYLGSKPGVANRGADILRFKFPELNIATMHGYYDASPDSEENLAVLKKIKEYKPHILMVGMGMPRQEHWILDNLDKLEANIILPSGACIDYVAGAVPTPPRFLGKLGLEWLYRLASEPARLWKRYLIEPWFVLFLFIKDFLMKISTFMNSEYQN
ncbi:WecB/TagA/CpsF family glycosyltransferase [Oscillatoria sp. CS-180]|uniref:WecB/TagA/CpsF family glycosyltransferase n=1 Tax=Oscillatoria sp. CS-180 TaxID=3021720 RepID=UPI00232BE0F1|nr:WecB/TagA/CpsF family glycosyltransferase [Oscillatoria sp. CS-180]MDB9526422.1 WecB/TagA/CpsF family glycosyltransferase [Oscillatoria sp. CS-180]